MRLKNLGVKINFYEKWYLLFITWVKKLLSNQVAPITHILPECNRFTAWKVSKYGVFSDLYFPVFIMNTEIYSVNLRIHSEYRKIRTRKNSVFRHFSRSDCSWKFEKFRQSQITCYIFWSAQVLFAFIKKRYI